MTETSVGCRLCDCPRQAAQGLRAHFGHGDRSFLITFYVAWRIRVIMAESEMTAGQWWSTKGEMTTVPLRQIRALAIALLEKAGATANDAGFIADIHLGKALQGDHERGIAMLSAQIRAAQRGDLDLRPDIRVLREMGATALVDGGAKASPKLVCRHAMALAIQKAREHGIGWVSARASGEILTPFIEQAVGAGMVTMIMAQSIPTVAPQGGLSPLLGNAPVGWGIPAGTHAPVIVDMSLTQTSAKGVALAATQGEAIPAGFILNRRGESSTDPNDFLDPEWRARGRQVAQGSLVPLGGSHKSYAMIFVVGLLTAILADADFAWNLGNDSAQPGRFGTLFLALDPKGFGDTNHVLARVDEYISHLRGAPRKDGVIDILYPGERSQALRHARRDADRLTLPLAHYRELYALSADRHRPA